MKKLDMVQISVIHMYWVHGLSEIFVQIIFVEGNFWKEGYVKCFSAGHEPVSLIFEAWNDAFFDGSDVFLVKIVF